MPVYNGATTLERVFAGLEAQESKDYIAELIIIDDNSGDASLEIIRNYSKKSSYKCELKTNKANLGLARGYNIGINKSRTTYVLTMHQDIVLEDTASFEKMLKPFLTEAKVGATYPTLLHPLNVWNEYNFWQKALFSRFVGKEIPMLTGKFDCFKRSTILEIGLFNAETYRTAGEDSDIKARLIRAGHLTVASGLRVIHIHNLESNFNIKRYVKKDAQIAEAQGVLLREYGADSLKQAALVFFRQGIFLGLFVPLLNFVAGILVGAFAYLYTRRLYHVPGEFINKMLLIFANISILPIATFYSLKGFMRGRQSL